MLCSDGATFISADDLRINLWNLEISNQSFNIVDVKPANMEDLTGKLICSFCVFCALSSSLFFTFPSFCFYCMRSSRIQINSMQTKKYQHLYYRYWMIVVRFYYSCWLLNKEKLLFYCLFFPHLYISSFRNN